MTCVDRDGTRARELARPVLASFLGEFGTNAMTDAYGISDQLRDMVERLGADGIAAEMPDEWLEDLTLVGSPSEVEAKMRTWLDAGLDSICIFFPDAELEEQTIQLVAESLIPAFR